jgi:hypothetical protein
MFFSDRPACPRGCFSTSSIISCFVYLCTIDREPNKRVTDSRHQLKIRFRKLVHVVFFSPRRRLPFIAPLYLYKERGGSHALAVTGTSGFREFGIAAFMANSQIPCWAEVWQNSMGASAAHGNFFLAPIAVDCDWYCISLRFVVTLLFTCRCADRS